jgi:hypothetical protein
MYVEALRKLNVEFEREIADMEQAIHLLQGALFHLKRWRKSLLVQDVIENINECIEDLKTHIYTTSKCMFIRPRRDDANLRR